MRLIWLERARRELGEAYAWIEPDDPQAARKVVERIIQAVERLQDFPQAGRNGRIAGTRELVVMRTPYIVAYQIDGNDIEILTVMHSRRLWPDQL